MLRIFQLGASPCLRCNVPPAQREFVTNFGYNQRSQPSLRSVDATLDLQIKTTSFKSSALTGGFFTTSATWEAHVYVCVYTHTHTHTHTHTYIICIFGTQDRALTMRQKRYVEKRFATSGDGGSVYDSGH